MKPLLQVEDLQVGFPIARSLTSALKREARPVLVACDGVDLEVHRGEIVGLVGESGSGKSTVARSIIGLNTIGGGRITFNGSDITSGIPGHLRPRIQMVFQDPSTSLNPRRTVGSILSELLALHSTRHESIQTQVSELLDAVGLAEQHTSAHPRSLSGGQRQRVAIARALATDPELIIADEAVSALDVSVQAAILNLIRDLVDDRGIAVLFITHDLSALGAIADRVAVMYLGRVIETGTVEEVLRSPRHPYTEALRLASPHITGRLIGAGQLQGEAPSPIAKPSGCRFHPRCPHATPECKTIAPPQITSGTRTFECHHPLG